jgi:hypothetical protein
MTMHDAPRAITLHIGELVLPASYDARDFAQRLEREIAERAGGPGPDPVVAALATRLLEALERTEETR